MTKSSLPARMIGYCRVSTGEQALSGLGLADQEQQIRAMATARGWRLTEVVRDEGASAGSLERPGLKGALERLAAGRADGLVVAKLDRLSRSTVDLGLLLEWFVLVDKAFVSLDLGVDTTTAGGQLVVNVLGAVAEWERSVISERTRAALAQLRAQGKPVGRPSVADDAELAARIRDMKHHGWTLRAIADQLNSEGVPTARGAERWQPSAIQAVLGYKRPRRARKRVDLPAPVR
jgi:DNA invertase Pin-like site-specific DNA recombinase